MSDRKPARHGHGQAAYPRTHKPPGCRWCGGAITDRRRRTFCSAECVHEYRVRSDPRYMREAVLARDRGVCACCGVDTEAWTRAYHRAAQRIKRMRPLALDDPRVFWRWRDEQLALISARWRELRALLRRAGRMAADGHTWEADHIVPVVEGGGQCGLDNLRTLCLHCHRRVTAELRTRMTGKRPPEPSGQRELAL